MDLEATWQNLEVAELMKVTAKQELTETSAALVASQGERQVRASFRRGVVHFRLWVIISLLSEMNS